MSGTNGACEGHEQLGEQVSLHLWKGPWSPTSFGISRHFLSLTMKFYLSLELWLTFSLSNHLLDHRSAFLDSQRSRLGINTGPQCAGRLVMPILTTQCACRTPSLSRKRPRSVPSRAVNELSRSWTIHYSRLDSVKARSCSIRILNELNLNLNFRLVL